MENEGRGAMEWLSKVEQRGTEIATREILLPFTCYVDAWSLDAAIAPAE
jgi:hypothetical protein